MERGDIDSGVEVGDGGQEGGAVGCVWCHWCAADADYAVGGLEVGGGLFSHRRVGVSERDVEVDFVRKHGLYQVDLFGGNLVGSCLKQMPQFIG